MAKKPIKTHTFNGRSYKIDVGQYEGSCDQFSGKDRFLEIYADLGTRKGLITAIHEALHAENWAKSEKTVDRVSSEIGSLLWRLGWRRQNNG